MRSASMKPPLFALILLVACSGTGGDPDSPAMSAVTADTLGEQSILSTAEYLASDDYAAVDLAWGERLAMQCRACHTLEPDGVNMIGPPLHGLFGKPAASASAYPYSAAMAEADFIWTPRALDAWLAQPARFLPGNTMSYAGLGRADDRRAVIAYLLSATDANSRE